MRKDLLVWFVAICVALAIGSPLLADQNESSPGANPYNPVFVSHGSGPGTWSCGNAGVGASLTQCQAAPGFGLRLYVTDITVQTTTGTAGTWQLRFGTGSNCATGTTVLYPNFVGSWVAPVNTVAPQFISFVTPLVVGSTTGANQALCVFGTATNTVAIDIHGYTAP